MRAECVLAILAIPSLSATSSGCGDPNGPTSDVTIAAVVNGIVWRPGGPGAPPTYAMYYEGDSTLSVGGLRATSSGHSEQIGISLRHVTGPGTYALEDPTTASAGLYVASDGHLLDGTLTMTWYWTSAARRGRVTISTLDPATHTARGTFEFEAETYTGARVTVTDGSFDGHYETNPSKGS